MAKLISSFGSAGILETGDPVLKIPFRFLFWAVGGLEIVIGLICLLRSKWRLQTGLVAWLATMFLVYRLGLLWIGYQRLCPCLGNLTDALHLPVHYAETAMKIILAYLLIGSYGILFHQWLTRKVEGGRQNDKLKAECGGGCSQTGVGS